MKTNYNLFKLRSAIRELSIEVPDDEVGHDSSKGDIIRIPQGYVIYGPNNGEMKYVPLYTSPVVNTATVSKTVSGDILIIVSDAELYSALLYPILAHEIGHIESDHFKNTEGNHIDIEPDKQKELIEKYNSAETEEEKEAIAQKYSILCFTSLLRGGVLTRELEADTKALEYCPLSFLLKAHAEKFKSKNASVRLEISNRIHRLINLDILSSKRIAVKQHDCLTRGFQIGDVMRSLPYHILFSGNLDTPELIKSTGFVMEIEDLEEKMALKKLFTEEDIEKLESFVGTEKGSLSKAQSDTKHLFGL